MSTDPETPPETAPEMLSEAPSGTRPETRPDEGAERKGEATPENDPVAVFKRGMEYVLAKDMVGFIGLYSDDAVMEFPFAPPGRPRRLEGRAAVHDYLIGYADWLDVRSITHTAVHRTQDSRVVIAEFAAEGLVVATGEPYEARYVAVLTVRDGRIAHYRDYWNPLTFFDVGGGGTAGAGPEGAAVEGGGAAA